MGKKKLNQYKGKLTSKQIVEGMNAANQNATRLLDDAVILLEAKRFASAGSLAILSIEEAGKISIMRGLVLATNDDERIKYWRDFRSHTKKNFMWLLYVLDKR